MFQLGSFDPLGGFNRVGVTDMLPTFARRILEFSMRLLPQASDLACDDRNVSARA
jgi:hypothetical protein